MAATKSKGGTKKKKKKKKLCSKHREEEFRRIRKKYEGKVITLIFELEKLRS